MATLQNKIDFIALVSVKDATPNGDPLNGNRPRTTYTGFGEISDVCIKRKLRNRLQDMGEAIFVQSNDRNDDGFDSLSKRFSESIHGCQTQEEYAKAACEKWLDVRTFGQVFAYKSKNDKESGVSVGVRGPLSLHMAKSISPVDITSMQITKSVNSESTDKGQKSSDTMGMKHYVNFGLYVIKGAINVQLAEKTDFSDEDAEKIKEALRTLFANDASSARPEGSMEVVQLYWFKHNNKIGQYSSAKVHGSLKITLKDGVQQPVSVDDYEICLMELEGLVPEILAGE